MGVAPALVAHPRDIREGRTTVGGCDLPAPGRRDADADEHRGPEVGFRIRSWCRRREPTGPVELSARDTDRRLVLVVDIEVGAPPEGLLPEAVGPVRKAVPDLASVAQHRPQARGPVPPRVVGVRRPSRRRVSGRRDERMCRLRQVTRRRDGRWGGSGNARRDSLGRRC